MSEADRRVVIHFDAECIKFDAHVENWRDAVQQAGGILVKRGFAGSSYPGRIISVIEQFGPYMVVAPGIALVHARPGDRNEAKKNGLALMTVPEGVNFGSAHNDPVYLVIALIATTAEDHLTLVSEIANALDVDGALNRTLAAETAEALLRRFSEAHAELDVRSSSDA